MCNAIMYQHEQRTIISKFSHPFAKLPVLNSQDEIIQMTWGRRIHESGNLPLGGWASLDSINDGKWDQFSPKTVKIAADKFMEKNIEDKDSWFTVTKGQYLQGLAVSFNREKRVYIVTIAPELEDAQYFRWPKFIA